MKCSHFQPAESSELDDEDVHKLRPKSEPFPCVIYCHGNAGSRVDALPLLPILLPQGVSVCSFDFAGAGQSEGQFLSLGYFEREDLRTVIEFLMSSQRVSRIGLWGHSMGASSCLLYAADGANDAVCAMVCDSPFSSLEAVIAETAASGKQKLSENGVPGIRLMPDMLIPMAVAAIRRSILSQAAFDIREVNPLSKCGASLIPVLFGHGEDDDMVAPYHSQRLHDAYGGNTTLIRFAGSHNSERGDLFLGSVTAFLMALLRPTDDAHPAEALLYPQPSALRGLMGRPALAESCRFTAGKGFQSAGVDAEGERCSHRGRTAGNLALLVKLCCLCNPAIRPPPRRMARRYRLVSPPSSPRMGQTALPPHDTGEVNNGLQRACSSLGGGDSTSAVYSTPPCAQALDVGVGVGSLAEGLAEGSLEAPAPTWTSLAQGLALDPLTNLPTLICDGLDNPTAVDEVVQGGGSTPILTEMTA